MNKILNTIFPKTFDNNFKGYKLAMYVFFAITVVTLWRSQHHLLSADGGAQTIATIPLDTFTSDGSQTVIGIFSLWGLSQLIIGIIYLVASLRYRSMIPLLYLLLIVEYSIRGFYIPLFKPVVTAGTAPGAAGNIPMIIISVVMLVLCLIKPKKKIKETP